MKTSFCRGTHVGVIASNFLSFRIFSSDNNSSVSIGGG